MFVFFFPSIARLAASLDLLDRPCGNEKSDVLHR